MNKIDKTLIDRAAKCGDFKNVSEVTQGIKRTMQDSKNWGSISDDKKEALDMIAHKIGRLLSGDSDHIDSWHDIAGYSKLIERDLDSDLIDSIEKVIEAREEELSRIDLVAIEDAVNEDMEYERMDIIARNGNDGLHYEPVNLMTRQSCDDEYLK